MEAQTGKFMEAGAGFSTGPWVFLSRTYRGASIMRLPCLSTLTPGPNVWALAQDAIVKTAKAKAAALNAVFIQNSLLLFLIALCFLHSSPGRPLVLCASRKLHN
jgi:hypothetical protein